MASHPLHPVVIVAVAAGGATGAGLRHLLTETVAAGTFPWVTFAINVSGSFLLALLAASAFVRRHPLLPATMGTGVLGGFTTLSAYSEESRSLLAQGHVWSAAGYVLGTLLACLLAVALADRFSTPADRAKFEHGDGDL